MDLISLAQTLIKLLVVLAYAGFGFFLLSAAAGRKLHFPALPHARFLFGLSGVAILVWFTSHSYLFFVSVALGIAVFAIQDGAWRSRDLVLAGAAVIIPSASLAWWLNDFSERPEWWQAVAFAAVVWCVQAGFMRRAERSARNWVPVLFLLFGAAAFMLLANVTQYVSGSTALELLVHHQGAYIGPAMDIRAGLVPLYDIPLQYGLGPTLSIAAVCGVASCRSGMAFLIISSGLVMGLLLLGMALTTRVVRGTIWRLTTTFAIFCAVFLWPGFTYLGSLPAASPSASGLRFLPVTLIAFLLYFGRSHLAALVLAPAILWSPETAVMSLVVFGVHETARLGFVRAVIRSVVIAGGSAVALAVVHHLIYGVWIQPDVIAEYILHVPGPLPVNPVSDFIVLASAMALGAWNVLRQPADTVAFRRDLVTATLLFAAASYYLGRSHPNNICNLMPFMVLVALRSLDGESPAALPALPRMTIIGLATAIAALSLSYWTVVPFQNGFSVDVDRIAVAASSEVTDKAALRSRILDPDHQAIADLRIWNRSYPVATNAWLPLDPGSLWSYVPSNRRQLYIKRSAARLHLAGWVMLDGDQRDWLNDLRIAYRVSDEKDYHIQPPGFDKPETYIIAHLTPLDEVGQLAGNKGNQ